MGENVLKLGTDSLGGYLSDPTFIRGLEQLIQPQTLFLQLCRNIPMSRTTVYLPPQVSSGPSLSWLGEGDRKPISDVAFSRQTMTARKVAVITPWTDELDAESFISMRGAIQGAISSAAGVEVDAKLWNGLPTTDEPDPVTGLLQQSGFLSATYGDKSDLGLDLKAMLREMRINDTEPSSYVVHPTVLDALQGIEDGNNRPKYPTTHAPQPTIWGKRIFATSNLPATGPDTDGFYTSTIVLARWSDVWVGRMPGSVVLLDQASLVQSDGSTMIHLAQEDKRALRYVARVSSPVIRRTTSVCTMESVVA